MIGRNMRSPAGQIKRGSNSIGRPPNRIRACLFRVVTGQSFALNFAEKRGQCQDCSSRRIWPLCEFRQGLILFRGVLFGIVNKHLW